MKLSFLAKKILLNNNMKSKPLQAILYFFLVFSLATSCTTFSPSAQSNSLDEYEMYKEGKYVKYTNSELGISMLQYGAFRYAQNKKQYKKLVKGTKVYRGRNKVLYANQTNMYQFDVIDYFFDLSIGEKNSYPKGYFSKTILCNGKDKVTLVVSKLKMDKKSNADFLIEHFKCIK
ncbi:hypothetical protein [Chryseobacterium sp.]|uniref:hypothetical protein n=1 Tax=Chryseobacterium sp. TaxID=1871047 RepID=UPI00289A8CC1|nr:hypothetical protein [Chryseobacterium sp.]